MWRRKSFGVVLFIFFLFCSAAPAGAQIFSPGELSKAHAEWDSMRDCHRCHATEAGSSAQRCLSCHEALAARIAKKRGYHALGAPAGKPCSTCHEEHRGRAAPLVVWPGRHRRRFPHAETGWPLSGKHRGLECTKCHETRAIRDPKVLAELRKHPEKQTFLGLDRRCTSCHFDEHRGQLGKDCTRCHDERGWKLASGFDHARVWKLEGAHRRVPCRKCHEPARDADFDPSAFPTPRSPTFLTMKPLAHERCTDCHTDPHRGRFGSRCLSCHGKESWKVTADRKKRAFHDRTAFPLEGRHRSVPCESCHRVGRDGKKHLKPIPHERCIDCHPNAHPDIPEPRMAELDCRSCHTEGGFDTFTFDIERHAKTAFPLTGAHRTVTCPECHLQGMGEPFAATEAVPVAGMLAAQTRSAWRFRLTGKDPADCASCHASPHREQFPERRCTDCHDTDRWRLADRFDHDRLTKFPLSGKHRQVPCEGCHREEKDSEGSFVRYRPLTFEGCDACHADVHYGQFTRIETPLSCEKCHRETGFEDLRFDHGDPTFSDWPLRGKHEGVACEACHPVVHLADRIEVRRFRPTPKACEGCHQDPHKGAFRELAGSVVGDDSADPSSAPPWGISPDWWHRPENATPCGTCHRETGWRPVTFDHGTTGFPLVGRHETLSCAECHTGEGARLPHDCAGCHRDVHRGRLGTNCAECHSEEGFGEASIRFSRHDRTNFPLIGAHAVLPCTECHQDVRNLGFDRVPAECAACHSEDAPTGIEGKVDHSTFSDACDRCHTQISWGDAGFLHHDRCFPIGLLAKHGGVSCTRCHRGVIPSATGTCRNSTFSCTQCHGCQEAAHRDVNGYECKERKCYRCHPGGER